MDGTVSRAYNDSGTDYSNQTKETWVDDINALDMVNGVLGAVQGSGYENFVNAGPYKALVKQVGKAEQSQSGSTTSSTTSENLMEMTLDVTRASNFAPMIVKIWVEENQGPGNKPMLIRGYFEVTEGVSTQYPYGVMEAHFSGKQLNNDGTEGDEVFNMAMSINADDDGNVLIQFNESCDEGNFQKISKVRAVAASDFSTGKAYSYEYEYDSNWMAEASETTSYVAFNADYFKIEENDNPEKVYDKNDLAHRVFRYKLFNKDTGAKVTRSSGFPIQLASGEYAYVGYWGLWAPYGVTVASGATVTKVETGEEYTVFKVGGKLKEHTQAEITLGDLAGVEMCYWNNGDYIITWDGTNFNKIGERDQNTGQIEYQDLGAVTFSNDWEGAWCETLRAWLPLGAADAAAGGTLTDLSVVKYHQEETVTPAKAQELNGGADLPLYYWGYAPSAPIDQTGIDNAATDEQTYWSNPTEVDYTFDVTNLVLKDGEGDAVTIGTELDLSNSIYQWGLHMCPLTTLGPDNYDSGTFWEIHNETTYYSWETGPNEWNQFVTVKDSNSQYVAFDAPLRFTYTHSTAKDLNGDATYDGKTFNIDYDGFELHLPWEFDATTNEWQPVISLKDGTVLGTDYVVKATEEALFMKEAGAGEGSSVVIDTSILPPTLQYDSTKTALVGALPANAELKVIKGEVI